MYSLENLLTLADINELGFLNQKQFNKENKILSFDEFDEEFQLSKYKSAKLIQKKIFKSNTNSYKIKKSKFSNLQTNLYLEFNKKFKDYPKKFIVEFKNANLDTEIELAAAIILKIKESFLVVPIINFNEEFLYSTTIQIPYHKQPDKFYNIDFDSYTDYLDNDVLKDDSSIENFPDSIMAIDYLVGSKLNKNKEIKFDYQAYKSISNFCLNSHKLEEYLEGSEDIEVDEKFDESFYWLISELELHAKEVSEIIINYDKKSILRIGLENIDGKIIYRPFQKEHLYNLLKKEEFSLILFIIIDIKKEVSEIRAYEWIEDEYFQLSKKELKTLVKENVIQLSREIPYKLYDN